MATRAEQRREVLDALALALRACPDVVEWSWWDLLRAAPLRSRVGADTLSDDVEAAIRVLRLERLPLPLMTAAPKTQAPVAERRWRRGEGTEEAVRLVLLGDDPGLGDRLTVAWAPILWEAVILLERARGGGIALADLRAAVGAAAKRAGLHTGTALSRVADDLALVRNVARGTVGPSPLTAAAIDRFRRAAADLARTCEAKRKALSQRGGGKALRAARRP